MNLDHDFVQVSKLREDPKKFTKNGTLFPQIQVKTKTKRSSPKTEHFFPRIQVDPYPQMYTRVKLLGGMQM